MAKNNDSSKNKGFKKRLASVLACTLVGVGTAGLLAGCSGDVTDILKTGSDAPETGVVGQLFLGY